MLLKNYIPKLNKKYSRIFFSGISSDSSKVKKNDIFFAIKGDKVDGNKYISAAIKKGAKIIISNNKKIKKKEKIVFLNSVNVRKLLAEVSYKILDKKPKIPIEVIIESSITAVVRYVFNRNGVNFHCLYSHDAVISLPISSTDPIMTTGQKAPGKIVANPITE